MVLLSPDPLAALAALEAELGDASSALAGALDSTAFEYGFTCPAGFFRGESLGAFSHVVGRGHASLLTNFDTFDTHTPLRRLLAHTLAWRCG
jgi:hypothetical protein